MKKHDVKTLPKWAQSRIEVLERNLQALKAERASVEQGTSPISYFVSPDIGKTYYLPRHAQLTFHFSDQDFIDVSLGDGVVSVSTSGTMAIKPKSSNTAWIDID